jgi:hypothetical protein
MMRKNPYVIEAVIDSERWLKKPLVDHLEENGPDEARMTLEISVHLCKKVGLDKVLKQMLPSIKKAVGRPYPDVEHPVFGDVMMTYRYRTDPPSSEDGYLSDFFVIIMNHVHLLFLAF